MFLNNTLCHCIIFSAVISCKYIFTKDKSISLVLKCEGLFHVINLLPSFLFQVVNFESFRTKR